MRFALFGDIHANLEALQAVLEDAKSQGCTDYICTGDIVGYNASPSECLQIIQDLNCPTIKGNHDEDSAGSHPLDKMNPVAAEALLWTREQLSTEQREWLQKLRMVRQIEDFTVVHATLDQPQTWNYVVNKFDAMSSFSYQFTNVCFHGHTHIPKVFIRGNNVNEVPAESVTVEPGSKYFINIGSVGQPRDGDWRACYAIYDVPSKLIVFRRLNYDISTTQQKIIQAGLPQMLADRLSEGR